MTEVIVPQVFSDFVGDRHTHLINTPPKYYGPGQGRTGRTIDTGPVSPCPPSPPPPIQNIHALYKRLPPYSAVTVNDVCTRTFN